jgi:hypothetical protein
MALGGDVSSYDFTVHDERWLERKTDVFTKANTAMLVPPGLITQFYGMPATPPERWVCRAVGGNIVILQYASATIPVPLSGEIAALIRDDVKIGAEAGNESVTTGNFTHLRFRNTGSATDYEVHTFDVDRRSYAGGLDAYQLRVTAAEYWQNPDPTVLLVALVWPTSQPSRGDTIRGYLYAPTHPPTASLPLHVGGAAGLHPAVLSRQVRQGTYSSTGIPLPRISTAAYAPLEADARYGRCWYRITAPETMAAFLERHEQAYGMAPVVDSSGRVAPISLYLPTSTEISIAGLPSITSTNAWTHPTWEHPSRDIVNVVRGTRQTYSYLSDISGQRSFMADRLQATTQSDLELTGTNTTLIGRRELALRYGAISVFYTTLHGGVQIPVLGLLPFSPIARSFITRYGDGPVYTSVEASSQVDATTNGRVMPGDFVKVVVPTFPNPASNARGSTRVMQVLRRQMGPRGPLFQLLDAGPNLSPISAPTISLALSSQSSRHTVRGAISSIPGGGVWHAQVGVGGSTGSTAPSHYYHVGTGTTASTSFLAGYLPSQRKIFGRVRADVPNRVGSGWSTVATVVTASITAPSSLAVSSVSAARAVFTWTNGSSLYDTAVMIDSATGATLGSSNTVDVVPRRTTRYEALGLSPSESYTCGVRHVDPFGGFSGQNTTTFTTTTGYLVAPQPKGIVILSGGT